MTQTNGSQPQINARLAEITPAMAEQLLARNTHNRSPSMARVAQYAIDMRKGDWQVNGEAIKISADGRILDGQHRLMAILEADTPVHTLLITGLPAETQETMDQGRARTFADVLKLRGERDYFNLAAAVRIVYLYERDGVPFQAGGRLGAPTVQQLCRCLERNPEIRDSVRLGSSLHRSWLSASTIAGMHYLFSIADPTDAEDFITKVCTGAHIGPGDATYMLRERLIKEHYDATGLHLKVKMAFVVRAWNAYRCGETLARLVWTPGGHNPDRFPQIDGLAAPHSDPDPLEAAA